MISFIDREAFIRHNMETLDFLLMEPGSPMDLMIGIGAAYVALAIAITKTHSVGSAQGGSLISGMFVAAVGTFGLIEIYAATEIMLIPYLSWESIAGEVILGSVLASFFLMVVPFTRVLFHASYWTSAGAWFIGAICAGLIVFGVSLIYEEQRPQPTKTIKEMQERLDVQ
jgi:hypothetical protein